MKPTKLYKNKGSFHVLGEKPCKSDKRIATLYPFVSIPTLRIQDFLWGKEEILPKAASINHGEYIVCSP